MTTTQELVSLQNELNCLYDKFRQLHEEINRVYIVDCYEDEDGDEVCYDTIHDDDLFYKLSKEKNEVYNQIDALRNKIRELNQ